ncbi:MAG: allantoinase AllB [Actinomycetota bacterium]|nr:allantoinase AllB [Actinomycetota bacterium]
MSADLAVRARRAVLADGERACTVVVRDGRVVDVAGPDAPVDTAEVVELADDEVLLPGLVDTHVHVNEPGRTEWEGFATATLAAAAGGVTTIVDMPLNSVPPTVDAAALQVKRKSAAEQCHVDVGFWGGAVPGSVGELPGLHAGGVFGFKCFLTDSGVEEFPPLSVDGLRAAMTEVARLGSLLIVHAEDGTVLSSAPPAKGAGYAGFLASRPPAAEDAAIECVQRLARETGARVHVLHLSSAGALATIARARADGVALTVETCPHYLTLTADEVPPGATEYKCCPPIRDAANREVLWEALGRGLVDIVVSDHSPCTPELKLRGGGDFGAAWGGIASLQLGLPLVWTAARARGHELAQVVGWMASGPAGLVGMQRKGRIAVGNDADLVVFAPEQGFVVDAGALRHRHPLTPYAGHRLTGVVRRTWLRGRIVDGTPRGVLLTRGEC